MIHRNSHARTRLLLTFLVAMIGIATPAEAEPVKIDYAHDHVNVFPASAVAPAAKVDGDLSEWKPEAFVQMSADKDLLDVYSFKLALAYDADGLLLAARFVDATPMMNIQDPAVSADVGWAGDALQFRLLSDAKAPSAEQTNASAYTNDQIAHLTMWYFAEKSQPAIDVRYGMDYHGAQTLVGEKANLAFKKTSDNSYAMEIRIPWSLVHAKASPKPGDSWSMTIQPLWGSGGKREEHSFFDLTSTAGFHYQSASRWGAGYFVKADEVDAKFAEQREQEAKRWSAPEKKPIAGGIPVKYINPAKGFVSLAICNADGLIVRTLLTKAERDAGEQTETWDGLDDDAKPAPPGEYRLKALTHPGIKPRFVMSIMNTGNPPWGSSLPHNGWGADHGNPISAASDSDGNTYLLWTFSEASSTLIAVDRTGQKQWGTSLPWGELGSSYISLAYDDGRLYVVKDGPQHPKGAGDPDIVNGGIMTYDAKTGRRAAFPDGKGTTTVSDWNKSLLAGADAQGLPGEKMRGGEFTPAESANGANIVALAASPDRVFASLYLENKIVALDKKTFQRAETYDVAKPAGLAYDTSRKLLYAISDRSIVMIDAGGKVTSVVKDALEYPFGLAVDKQGNLYASVRGKQMRVLVFDPNGKPLRQIGKSGGRPWIGKYDPSGMLMPAGISVDAQDRLWVTECDSTPKRISLWDSASAKLTREFYGAAAYSPGIFAATDKPEEVYMHNCRFIVDYEKGTWKVDATMWRSRYEEGVTPGIPNDASASASTPAVMGYEGKQFAYDGATVYAVLEDRLKPVYCTAHGGPSMAEWFMPDPSHSVGYEWFDNNGDGRTSADEVRQVPLSVSNGRRTGFMDRLLPGLVYVRGTGNQPQMKLFRPKGLRPDGIPNYPKAEDAEWIFRSTTGPMAKYDRFEDRWPVGGTDYEQWYAIASTTTAAGASNDDSILRFDRDGKILWRYNRAKIWFGLGAPLARMGDFYGALDFVGTAQFPKEGAGEVVGVGLYRGYFSFLNEDGLFIDQIGYDNGRGVTPNFDTYFIENFCGDFFRHPKTGKCYLLAGDVDGRVLELQGFENIRRFDAGKLNVSEAQFKQIAGGSAGDGAAAKDKIVHVAPGKEPKEFSKIALDESRAAEVGLSYDADNLYAVYKVPDATPWQNAVKDWRFLFKTGDAVDLQLGIQEPAAARRKPQTGDVRVLIGPGETPDAFSVVGMWMKYLPTGMEQQPQLYQSPTGAESFARVAPLATVKCSIQRDAGSYTLKATIPWKELGLKPPTSGSYLVGDLGVLQSDGSGTQTVLRRYLFNQDTAITNDVPSEVRIDLSNWRKIYFE